MGYFWVSLYLSLRGGKERVSLEDCLLRALGSALNRVPLHCGNQRTLPRIVTQKKKGEEINEVAVIHVPRGVLPSNALHLGTRSLRDRNLLLYWKNHLRGRGESCHITVIKDMSVTVSRHMSATALAKVRVHVRVDVRMRHLNWCKGIVIVWRRQRSILLKKIVVFFVLFCLFLI